MDSYFIDLMKMVLTLSHREERKPNTRSARLQLLNMERMYAWKEKRS